MKRRKKQVAVVFCNGGSNAQSGINRASLDCAQLSAKYPSGILECAYGCLGGGSCVTACKVSAIRINDRNVAEIIREKCLGCGLCVKACPQGVIHMVLPENVIAPQCSNREPGAAAKKQCSLSCIACRICEKNCPAGAIAVVDNRAVIDQERCIACGMCAVKCPRGVIVDADGVLS